jgi:hypothetical protein
MIGQIANCPKCNSMIQITEPQITQPRQIRVESHRGVIDSSAMTKETFAPELEDEYRLAPSQTAEPEMNSPAALIAPPRVDDEPMFTDPINASVGGGQAIESNSIQLLAVRRSARRRQVLMVAVLGASGILFAGMLFAGFLYWYTSKSNPPIAKNSANANQGGSEKKHVGPKLEQEQVLAIDPLAEPELDPLAEPPVPAIEGGPNTNSPPESQAESTEDKNTVGTAVNNVPANPKTSQPNRPLPNVTEQPDAPNSETTDKTATELPDQLKKFQSILDTSIEPQFLEDQAVQKAPPTAKELGLSTGHDAKAIPAVDVGKQMQLTLTALLVPPGSTSNTVSQWVQVSGVPTVVDLDSLVAAGIDPYKPLGKILVSDARPLAQVGASIAKEMGVDLITLENRFLAFQASEEAIRAHIPTAITISDLLADNEQQQWLVRTLNQIWPEYEGKWIVRDGELTADPDSVDAVAWFWAVRMLESWRLTAGVETQLDNTKLDQSKFVTKFVDPEQIKDLNKPLNLKLVNRAPVAELVSEISSASGMHVWVDWASVGQKGLGPNTIDFIVTQDRSLRQCMRDLAEKYSLVVACEGDKSIVITTADVYRAQPRLFVLPSQGKTPEQWMEELQPLTPATANAAQPVLAFLTPDSRFVIVRCCRPRIRS